MLQLTNLSILAEKKTILEKINLALEPGTIYTLEGKNGSGKTSLAQSIVANPDFQITGNIFFKNQNMVELNSEQRSLLGIFVSSSQPIELKGVSIISFLKVVLQTHLENKKQKLDIASLLKKVKEIQKQLDLPDDFYKKDFGFGLSSGQKKKLEILQMLILDPELIILDEIDSGLDQKSQETLVRIIKTFLTPKRTFLIISHNTNFIKNLVPEEKLEIKETNIYPQK